MPPERVGLVNRVVAADRLTAWAIEKAEAIAANSPVAVQAVKRQISTSIADFAKSREALEQELGDRVRASPDFAEGVAAFRAKRLPDYRCARAAPASVGPRALFVALEFPPLPT